MSTPLTYLLFCFTKNFEFIERNKSKMDREDLLKEQYAMAGADGDN